MTSGELKVLMALDKLGEYIQNGSAPYKSINVSFTQLSDDSVYYDELSNDSGYNLNLDGPGPGMINVVTDIPNIRGTQLFVSPLTHPDDYCAIEVMSNSPYIFRLYSMKAGGGGVRDAAGFGNDGQTRVAFEIRIYPE